jgi:MoaA/NifB/PqqE/SkfB family radical SAM enzyme
MKIISTHKRRLISQLFDRFFNLTAVRHLERKLILFRNISLKKSINIVQTGFYYITGASKINTLPPLIKVELSAACNLACTVCVHSNRDDLKGQKFNDKMDLSIFKQLVDEVKGTVFGLSLHYLGEAFLYPYIIDAIEYARKNGLTTHIGSNFSYKISEKFMREIVNSGLTHLTVCVDGLSNETYQRTRVNGNIEVVIDNLKRLIDAKNRLKVGPYIEVQYIEFKHNSHELRDAMKLFENLGVDAVATVRGSLHNYIDMHPDKYNIEEPLCKMKKPRCWWPWGSTTIKPNGDVIPCCTHRIGDQFVPGKNQRTLGNINDTSFLEIWRNEAYQNARRLCLDPSLFDKEPELKEHFCYGCDRLFKTNKSENMRLYS